MLKIDVFAQSRWADLACLLAGAVLPLAFAPLGLFPIAVLAPALLFTLWSAVPARRAFRQGFGFGLGLFSVGASWIYISIIQFGGIGPALAATFTALFILIMALYPAVAGWIANRYFAARPGVRLLLVYPLLWTASEWLRGWLFSGFNWLNLGSSQFATPLVGLAPLLGVYGVSASVAFSAGVLAYLLKRAAPKKAQVAAIALGLWAGSWAVGLVDWTQPADDPLRVSLVQGNIPQEIKWRPNQLKLTLDLYRRLTREHWGSDVIIWPETAVPDYLHRVQRDFLTPLDREARAHDSALLLGVAYRDPVSGRFYNSMVGLGRSGGLYHKRHLVPFGEYLPFKPLLAGILDFLRIPLSDFSAGDRDQPLLRMAGYPVGISICYEDAYGREVINSLPAAAFLVNASNDAWFGNSLAPHQHLEIARMRALETGRYLLRATNTGISAVIGPRGEVRTRSPQFETTVITDTVVPMAGLTPYGRCGDWPLVIGLIPLFVALKRSR